MGSPPGRLQSGATVTRYGQGALVWFSDARTGPGKGLWLGRDDARALARALLAALGEEEAYGGSG